MTVHIIKIRPKITVYISLENKKEITIVEGYNLINISIGDFSDMCSWTKEKLLEVMK